MRMVNLEEWISSLLSPKYKGSDEKEKKEKEMLAQFWSEFYYYAEALPRHEIPEEMCGNKFPESVYYLRYQNGVMGLLKDFKESHSRINNRVDATPEEFEDLQRKIENITIKFDEKNIRKSCKNILMMLIDENKECARDYLLKKLDSKKDLDLIGSLDIYTLEALIVHVLCQLFSSPNGDIMIRLATMIDQLDVHTRTHISIVRSLKGNAEVSLEESTDWIKNRKTRDSYTIGIALVEFMENERGLIMTKNGSGENPKTKKKGAAYYRDKTLYVICNLDINLLPIKLNCPMVSPPIEWKTTNANAKSLSDIKGGYLCKQTSAMYDRYRLLSTSSIDNLYIELNNPEKLCQIMSSLQSHPFEINSHFLCFIELNRALFVENGLLSPPFVSYLNIQECTGKLRELYMKNESIKEKFTYNDLLLTLEKDIQKARHEKMILELAYAYEGFRFYLPAFLDFRGRIYRCGVLHFHERDLSRSLIHFADAGAPRQEVAEAATCFHFQSYPSKEKALQAYYEELVEGAKDYAIYPTNKILNSGYDGDYYRPLISLASDAKHHLQFLSSFLSVYINEMPYHGMPITQDASASAYQIMSYFLLNHSMALRTNLIPDDIGRKIHDIYTDIKGDLLEYIEKKNR